MRYLYNSFQSISYRLILILLLACLLGLAVHPTKSAAKSKKFAVAQSTCITPPSGLVSWWPSDGNASDIAGGNNGTTQNGVTFGTGFVGQAFSLDGVDDYINVPDSASLRAITNAITVDSWINPQMPSAPPLGGVGAGRAAIFARRDPNSRESFELDIRADGRISVIVGATNSSTSVFVSSNPVIQFNNQWKHVAATANTTTGVAKCYVNGQEVPLSTEFGPTTFSGQLYTVSNLFIGRRQDINDIGGFEGAAGAAYYKGLIDEVDLFNHDLSASEIQAIFNAGSAGKCKLATSGPVELLPYQAAGYRYTIINPDQAPPSGFEQPGFNDSSWSTGVAAFGFSVGYCPLQATVHTVWPLNTHLLVRRAITVPQGMSNLRVMLGVDNDIEDVFFNGVRISTPQIHGDCPSLDNYSFNVPQALINVGDNVVAYHVVDRGGESFFDSRILGDQSPQQRPLIFIPGIAGSVLRTTGALGHNVWPSEPIEYDNLSLDPRREVPNFIASDVIRVTGVPGGPGDVYGSLLNFLEDSRLGGYHEYQVNGDPNRRTTAGCDLTQRRDDPNQNPNLFIFAYDWRKSNRENAALLSDYVGCVQRFYLNDPNLKIDILTHSMGGLVARRYMLDHATDHHVGKFITIAAPWLGAPKAINVLETGAFLDGGLGRLITNGTFKALTEYFPGVHELLPSEAYFSLCQPNTILCRNYPYSLDGHTITNYHSFVNLVNIRFPRSTPGTTGQDFHNIFGQDNERDMPLGVQHFHFYGVEYYRGGPVRQTIESVGISTQCVRILDRCVSRGRDVYTYTYGDHTVPLLSAERRATALGLDLNADGATLMRFTRPNDNDPKAESLLHTGLARNHDVQLAVLTALGSNPTSQSQVLANMLATASEVQAQPAYYFKLAGTSFINVTDASGNSTNPLSDPPDEGLPGTTSNITGEKAVDIIVPLDQVYTVMFRTDTDPLSIEITREIDLPDQAIRYQDLVLPAGVMAKVRFTPQGIENLVYDSDGNGTFETTVTPTVSASGTSAQDVTPPTVNVSETRQQSFTLVTLTASDSESGVKAIYYSADGSSFRPYTTPFNVDPYRNPVIYAFADDNVANRSSLSTYQLTAPASTLQFNISNYNVNEGDGRATITVTRTGDTLGTATVDYATTDNTAAIRCDNTTTLPGVAFARCDYATTIDTLTFAPGETQKTFAIPIIDDVYVEGAEMVQLRLSNVSGATLGAQSSATLTINDNDTTAGAVNPIFASPFFVRMQYLDFLSREPDAPGFNAWLNVLNNCADVNNVDPNASSAQCDRILVSSSFFGSQEFQLKGFFVFRFYRVAFARLPQYTEIVADMRNVTGRTGQEVFTKKAAFTNLFAQRQEFTNAYGNMTNAQYVAALLGRYQLTQITTPDPANPDGSQKVTLTSADLVSRLDASTLTRAQVLRAVADSDQVFTLEFNQAFVGMQYYGYLRRTPDAPGFNAWFNYLTTHPTDFRTMVNGFMNSQEYRLRFGQP